MFSRFSKPIAVTARVLVNQIFFTPIFLTAFFSLQSLLTGSTGRETTEKLKTTLPGAYVNSCQLWPAVTAINFWWIKLEYRSMFSGVIAIGWNSYLSYLNQQQVQQTAKIEELQESPKGLQAQPKEESSMITRIIEGFKQGQKATA